MRSGLTRAGGAVAVGLSALWALAAAGLTAFGVAIFVSGRNSDASLDPEGFVEFAGGSMAFAGAVVLACAVGGILLGRKFRRGADGRVGLFLLFLLFSAVSGMFLASSFADESGVDAGGVVGFGLNTLACLVVVVSALAAGGH